MPDSTDKDLVISELAEALRATLPLITMAVNDKRASEQFQAKNRQLRMQAYIALTNAKPFWIPNPPPESKAPDDG